MDFFVITSFCRFWAETVKVWSICVSGTWNNPGLHWIFKNKDAATIIWKKYFFHFTLLENLKLCPNFGFSEKNNNMVNLNFQNSAIFKFLLILYLHKITIFGAKIIGFFKMISLHYFWHIFGAKIVTLCIRDFSDIFLH